MSERHETVSQKNSAKFTAENYWEKDLGWNSQKIFKDDYQNPGGREKEFHENLTALFWKTSMAWI